MSSIDSHQFNVNLNTFKGPLDVLLDLAKSQKVNLEDISITKLADQFHDFITKAENLNLELASDYLLMATWLTYLKSKLLLPTTGDEEFKILEVAKLFSNKIKMLPPRRGERYASALTRMHLNNKVYKYYGKISLKNYVNGLISKQK